MRRVDKRDRALQYGRHVGGGHRTVETPITSHIFVTIEREDACMCGEPYPNPTEEELRDVVEQRLYRGESQREIRSVRAGVDYMACGWSRVTRRPVQAGVTKTYHLCPKCSEESNL